VENPHWTLLMNYRVIRSRSDRQIFVWSNRVKIAIPLFSHKTFIIIYRFLFNRNEHYRVYRLTLYHVYYYYYILYRHVDGYIYTIAAHRSYGVGGGSYENVENRYFSRSPTIIPSSFIHTL